MKALTAILAISLALLSFACGGDDAATGETDTTSASSEVPEPRFPSGTTSADPHFATVTSGEGARAEPKIVPPDLPPPKELMVRDLEEGTGRVAYRSDEVSIYYVGVTYETGKQRYFRWPPVSPLWEIRLGSGGSGDGFEEGIEGMRVGGRREILVPAHLMYGAGATDYVVELVSVNPSILSRGG